jgi:hypothetical protein
MAVRVGHECEDFRGRRPHKYLAGDPARAGVDLNHSVSHVSDCTLRPPANRWASRAMKSKPR